jgi:hypothetical protein
MLAPVISHQRFGNGLFIRLDPAIAEFRQHVRLALAREERMASILISACDTEIEQYLEAFESKKSRVNPPEAFTPVSQEEQRPKGSEPCFDLKSHLHRIRSGHNHDPRDQFLHRANAFTRIGPDFSKFDCGGAFTSWLGVCPDNRVERWHSALGQNTPRQQSSDDCPAPTYDETICATNEACNRRRPRPGSSSLHSTTIVAIGRLRHTSHSTGMRAGFDVLDLYFARAVRLSLRRAACYHLDQVTIETGRNVRQGKFEDALLTKVSSQNPSSWRPGRWQGTALKHALLS